MLISQTSSSWTGFASTFLRLGFKPIACRVPLRPTMRYTLVRRVKRIQLAPCRKVASNLVSDLLLAQGALRSVAHYPRKLGPAPSLRFTACR